MPNGHNFQHLPLILRETGAARITGGGSVSGQTKDNRQNRRRHSTRLQQGMASFLSSWQTRQAARQQEDLPTLPPGVPLLLEVDPNLDIDDLRHHLGFEIVSEEEAGYVIVASQDVNLTDFLQRIQDFAGEIRGSATIASVHRLDDDPDQIDRLKLVLSDHLFEQWPALEEDNTYLVDVGITCLGTGEIKTPPKRGKRDWARKQRDWATDRSEVYDGWYAIQDERIDEARTIIVDGYGGEIKQIVHDEPVDAVTLPDSFTIRIEVSGKGLKDFVLNFPYIFEVVEPDDSELPQYESKAQEEPYPIAELDAPADDAPTVCVIDSGIQEEHALLELAMDTVNSRCFLPDPTAPTDVADFVRPGGHGTRVAGAVLYGETIPRTGRYSLPCWIQNARVLDADARMPQELFPPAVLRAVVETYHKGPRQTRIFNHSINANCHCRLRHMSAWAAQIGALCQQFDVLIIQSVGNLWETAPPPSAGIKDHLAAGRDYPVYLTERSSRVANPAQSLQAITVGSVAYQTYEGVGWRSFATEDGQPSSFSRSGLGIWDVIKPDVVEFGGDYLRSPGVPTLLATPLEGRDCYPELVRSTLHAPGPPYEKDEIGTSFAAPKVTHIAAALQRLLPEEPCLLYRALIIQSARWPGWTRTALDLDTTKTLRSLGYGVPSMERATTNTDYRTTFITGGETDIKAGECHVYEVPIPESMWRPGEDYDILIEVTLSYVAQPRRTRRNLRRYLSTWVDWKSSRLGESLDSFRRRALKDQEDVSGASGDTLPWTIGIRSDHGSIEGVRRTAGTIQKDWATVKSNAFPESFCIAVVGHQGWSKDPDSVASYALAVSFESLGQEIPIYEDLRVAVEELQEELELEEEIEVEADGT